MKTSMPVVSPYLEGLWNQVLAEKSWNVKQLAEASGVSYGYIRKIVNGTLIPSRDALRRMCAATGQDFATVWRATHLDQDANYPIPDLSGLARLFPAVHKMLDDESSATDNRGLSHQRVSEIEESVADLMRDKVKDLMNTLPLAGVAELLQQAKELFQKYNPGSSPIQSK